MLGTNEIQKLKHSAVRLTFKLSKDELRQEYNAQLKKILQDLQLPGFRRGKVPAQVLERKAGSALKDEVLNKIIGEYVADYFKQDSVQREDKPLPYSETEIDGEPKLNLDNPDGLSFSVKYDVSPKVSLDKWEGLEITVDTAEVTDADVQRELAKIQERNSVVMERDENAPAQNGDVVTMDYCELNEDGTPVVGTERQDFTWTLGTGQNYYKIDDVVLGMKKAETKDFDKALPSDFLENDKAGKTIKMRVTVKTIREKQVPALNDDLAQDVSEKYHTLDDLKKDLREKLETRLADGMKAHRQDALISKLIDENPLDLPESMIRYEIVREYSHTFGGGRSWEDNSAMLDRSPSLVELYRQRVERSLKSSFLVGELITKNNIEATDDERKAELEKYAAELDMSVEDAQKNLGADANTAFDTYIKQTKAFNLLESKNTVKIGEKKSLVDLFPDMG